MYDGSNCEMFGEWFGGSMPYEKCACCDRWRSCSKERNETVRVVVKAMVEEGIIK